MGNYVLEGPKWAMPSSVTWSFAPADGTDFTGSIGSPYQATVLAALAKWSQVSGVQFQQVAAGTVGTDVLIGWHKFGASASQVGETDYSYLGSGNAETFVPGTKVEVEDPSERQLVQQSDGGYVYANTASTFYQTVLHELGHSLGLGHSSDPSQVMYPSLGVMDRDLGSGDIAGIQALYPGSANATPQPAPATQTSSAQVAVSQTQAPQTQVMQPQVAQTQTASTAVLRYFDTTNGTHFYTASQSEASSLAVTRPDLVSEGTSFMSVNSGAAAAIPVYRFFDTVYGTHFFTASAEERSSVQATRPDMTYEGVAFYADATQQAGDNAVYRFFDKSNGTHLYTSDANERNTISATLPDYRYEGVSFWAPSPKTV